MGKLAKAILLPAALLALSGNAAADNFWVGFKAGSLGIGAEATWRPIEWMDLRVGVNRFEYDEQGSQAGINYDGTLRLDNYYGTFNFRFPLSPFRVTAGAYSNANAILLQSVEGQTFSIGGQAFSNDEVGTLRSETSWDSVAPYLGAGFDFEVFNRLGLTFDFGVLWQGEPTVTLTADGTAVGTGLFDDALEQERQELADDFDALKAYPVLSLGFNFNF